MRILVSDTSVLVDLERGGLLSHAFRLAAEFAVPDVLFERELKPYGGDRWRELGLRVETLDGAGVEHAQSFRRTNPGLTLSDAFALSLAKTNDWTLLTGDAALRAMAESETVDCHGLLWLLDQLEHERAASQVELHAGLVRITVNPRCRLPKLEVETRLKRYVVG
jgi:hypothetical protein